jgi:hypothetical protein
MALGSNREPFYEDPVAYLEHMTGKKVKSIQRDPGRFGRWVLYTDGTAQYVEEGGMFKVGEFVDPPKSICVSCGEESHFGSWDFAGRCATTMKNLWKKARKVYWHRYLKNKQ